MTGRYAVGFLFLTLPPDKVDVNVHPTKAEVRFQENSLIYSLVRSAVKTRLLSENLVPRLTVPAGQDRDWSQESGVRRQDRGSGLVPVAARGHGAADDRAVGVAGSQPRGVDPRRPIR